MRNAVRFPLVALALVSGLSACKSAATRPTSDRPFTQSDLDGCLKAAQTTYPGLAREDSPGTATVYMLVDADGAVPVAFVHDTKNLDAPLLRRCISDYAAASKFEGLGVDFLRPEVVEFSGIHSRKKGIEGTVAPLDEAVAKETLTYADWATETDRGWGSYYTHQYADAVAHFRKALAAKADDTRALRGLATALADSNGDLKEAREAADKAVAAKPDSAATQEALVHVCVAAKDDECVARAFSAAAKAKDVGPRSFDLKQLETQAKEAAARYDAKLASGQGAAGGKGAAAGGAAAADPTGCASMPEGDEKTLCLVKYCFGEGVQQYMGALSTQMGQKYSGTAWSAKAAGDRTDVTVKMLAAGKKKGGAKPKTATWSVVTKGDTLDLKPKDAPANMIATQYKNACK